MTKVRFLTLSVIALVLLNAAMVVGMVMAQPGPKGDDPGGPGPGSGGPGGPNQQRPKEVVIERLQFDEGQIKEYEQLIEVHKATVKEQDKGIRGAKKELYALLNAEDQTLKEPLIEKIAGHIIVIETAHFEHFAGIRQICREDQLPAFEALTSELSRIFAPIGRPGTKGPPGKRGPGPGGRPPGE